MAVQFSCRSFVTSWLLLACAVAFSPVLAVSSSSSSSASASFQVRSLSASGTTHQQSSGSDRQLFDFDKITFSEDGEPVELPAYQIQLYPTTQSISDTSQLAIETSLEEYLRNHFEDLYPKTDNDNGGDDDSSGPPEFVSVSVSVVGATSFEYGRVRSLQTAADATTSSSTRPHDRSLVAYGTTLDVETTMRFQDGNFPSSSDLEANMEDALFDNFNVFLSDYLSVYATPELLGVDTGNYLSGFTPSPTMSPTKPTMAPTISSGVIAGANRDQPVNATDDGNWLKSLYPAIFCGVAMFMLTGLWLASRRVRMSEVDDGSYLDGESKSYPESMAPSSAMEHISVDYDGRQEARELAEAEAMERERQSQRIEREREYQRQKRRGMQEMGANSKYHLGLIHSVPMTDGETTVHVPPSMEYRSSSKRYDPTAITMRQGSSIQGSYNHEEMAAEDESEIGFSRTRSAQTRESRRSRGSRSHQYQRGMAAGSVMSSSQDSQSQYSQSQTSHGVSEYTNDYSHSQISYRTGGTEDYSKEYTQYINPNDGYEHALPSMHGGGEFGMGNAINRGLL
eukprot:Nitzschia sp. Nitz4//scaffold27_size158506//117784//119484//NITZ4_002616-RA/size158506-processed-gene-0.243-mRNA-1//1//CDS//3329545536//3701//frame0